MSCSGREQLKPKCLLEPMFRTSLPCRVRFKESRQNNDNTERLHKNHSTEIHYFIWVCRESQSDVSPLVAELLKPSQGSPEIQHEVSECIDRFISRYLNTAECGAQQGQHTRLWPHPNKKGITMMRPSGNNAVPLLFLTSWAALSFIRLSRWNSVFCFWMICCISCFHLLA